MSGRCGVADAIRALRDEKLQARIRRRLLILATWTWEDLISSETVVSLKGGDEIYELKLAGSGRWGIRMFFARTTCVGHEVSLVTELDLRRVLNRKGKYDAAIARATRLRVEWESRNCRELR
jgi:hypothetical protein